MVIVCQPAAESASIWAVKISGDTIRLATSPDSPAGGLTRWYSRIGTCSVKAGPEVGTSAGAGVGGGGAEHSESKPGAQAVVVGEEETVGVSAGSGCHCSVVGSGVPAAPAVLAEDARAAYSEGAALDGADTPGWRNDEAATSVAPTHRTRAMPKPARIDARRADRLVRLMMTPSISLTAFIVRAPRQSGAGCAASIPRSAPGSAFAVTRRLCSPRHTAMGRSRMQHVGFVGLGTMGASMATNLLKAGSSLTVWNRTPGRASALVKAGAQEAASPSGVAAVSDVVFVCVSDTPDVEAVLFGPDGVADGASQGSLVIDCSTISPNATRDFGRRLAERGVGMVDAPVSGGSEGASLGTLTMFVGGTESD